MSKLHECLSSGVGGVAKGEGQADEWMYGQDGCCHLNGQGIKTFRSLMKQNIMWMKNVLNAVGKVDGEMEGLIGSCWLFG